eukprot:CAMPEP_0117485544 /NCGR_PEP_ID=MMETSP0784-20121206/15020_1 /TAXON_ID=39447 /ORGANISM="" /LENGTH=37 /DNA_ID= /DNA_START= /DNA_END= /DNA_ORIENTATION=
MTTNAKLSAPWDCTANSSNCTRVGRVTVNDMDIAMAS